VSHAVIHLGKEDGQAYLFQRKQSVLFQKISITSQKDFLDFLHVYSPKTLSLFIEPHRVESEAFSLTGLSWYDRLLLKNRLKREKGSEDRFSLGTKKMSYGAQEFLVQTLCDVSDSQRSLIQHICQTGIGIRHFDVAPRLLKPFPRADSPLQKDTLSWSALLYNVENTLMLAAFCNNFLMSVRELPALSAFSASSNAKASREYEIAQTFHYLHNNLFPVLGSLIISCQDGVEPLQLEKLTEFLNLSFEETETFPAQIPWESFALPFSFFSKGRAFFARFIRSRSKISEEKTQNESTEPYAAYYPSQAQNRKAHNLFEERDRGPVQAAYYAYSPVQKSHNIYRGLRNVRLGSTVFSCVAVFAAIYNTHCLYQENKKKKDMLSQPWGASLPLTAEAFQKLKIKIEFRRAKGLLCAYHQQFQGEDLSKHLVNVFKSIRPGQFLQSLSGQASEGPVGQIDPHFALHAQYSPSLLYREEKLTKAKKEKLFLQTKKAHLASFQRLFGNHSMQISVQSHNDMVTAEVTVLKAKPYEEKMKKNPIIAKAGKRKNQPKSKTRPSKGRPSGESL
jgi:hypothetical protein